jgi:alpha-galactosidase
VAFFNRATEPAKINVRWTDIGITGKKRLRDLWLHQSVEWTGPEYSLTVPGHGVVMLRVS